MANLVGFIANKLILNSSNFRREIVGLERINDVYTARTQDAATFSEIIKNGASHKTVTGYLSPAPSILNRYEKMLVENVTSENLPGEITTFNVTYVGLFRDLNPKPLISLAPVDTYAFNPYSVNIEFVTELGEPGSSKDVNFLRSYQKFRIAPDTINGYAMPRSSVAPFGGANPALLNIVSQSPFFARTIGQYQSYDRWTRNPERQEPLLSREGTRIPDSQPVTPALPYVFFAGFVITGISVNRYGLFGHVILSVADGARYNYYIQDSNTFVEEALNLL